MNLIFLNPFLLFGLAAAALPILIHRITQKKAVVRKFSAVRFLLQSQQITARPQRLKHLLLLALRILAIATIVFMMARPVLVRPGSAGLLSGGAKVLILDNSLSMGYQADKGQRYDDAKNAAKEALEGFSGQVALIPMVSTQQEKGQGFQWKKPEAVLRQLDEIPLTFGRGNPASAFNSAYRMLKDLKLPKQILILSDLARSDWEGLDLTQLGIISDADITFFRMGGPGRDSNFRIKDVRLAKEEMVAGIPTRLEVTVSNLSDQAGTPLVRINLSGIKVDQKTIHLNSGQDGTVFFNLLVDNPGWINGAVKLSDDSLSSDDIFYFPLKVKKKIKILVVDGDPKTSLRASESYYLVSALRPGGLEGSPFLTSVITENEMTRVDLRSYDALFLLNVARPDFSRMASFLEIGKPIFIFLGDRIVSEVYNRFSLAPWEIRERNDLSQQAEKMTKIDSSRVALKFLTGLDEGLKRAVFFTYFKVDGAAKNLLTLRNQDPLLVVADAGKSKIFMFTSSADLDWNDLPLMAAYLPLIQGLVKEVVGLTGRSLPAGIRFGEPFKEKGRALQITGPRGGPGIFGLSTSDDELRRSVNTPLEESDLAKLSEDALKKKFGAIDVKVVEYKPGGIKNLKGGRKELWSVFLGFLLAVLTLEMFITNGIPRFKK